MDMVFKLQYFIWKMDAWSVSELVGGSSDTVGPQHLVQDLGGGGADAMMWSPKCMESVSSLRQLPGPPQAQVFAALLVFLAQMLHPPLASQPCFLGDCELPAGSTLISVPAETRLVTTPRASLLGEPHLTHSVAPTSAGAWVPTLSAFRLGSIFIQLSRLLCA